MNHNKMIAIIKAVLSGLVFGLGQVFNRQFIKAAMFFAVFALLAFVEFNSGNYGHEFDLYEDKLAGEDVRAEISNYYVQYYYYNLEAVADSQGNNDAEDYTDTTLLEFAAEKNGLVYDTEFNLFIDPLTNATVEPYNVFLTPEQMYEILGQQLQIVEDEAASSGTGGLSTLAEQYANDVIDLKVEEAIYETAKTYAVADALYPTLLETTKESIATLELVTAGNTVGEAGWDATLAGYLVSNNEALILSAEAQIITDKYNEIFDDEYAAVYSSVFKINYLNNYNFKYNELYGELSVENETIAGFKDLLYSQFLQASLNMDSDDANRMLVRIYYSYNQEEFDTLVTRLDNHFFERGGFFSKGIWGLVTMGSVPAVSITSHGALGFLLPDIGSDALVYQQVQIQGHHSTRLLLNGIISMIAILYLLIIYVWNIRDAYHTSIYNSTHDERQGEKKYYKDLYENFFEYIVLSPAVIVISFISIMPIFFGIAVAFTNYNGDHLPPGQLIEWVGFDNFKSVFNMSSDSDINFGAQFWKVFSWTLIWAFGATFTCFFGGFIQAIIISNKRVVFRKFWRSILILPWAVPALISQMMFRVMFNDTGYINTVLNNIGVTKLFTDLGFIGKTYAEAINAGVIERFFHMGTQNFEWLSNAANPWFVRIFIIVLNVWLGFPFFMALMSGVMTSIDKSLYEAASIDGATGFQQFKFITMPLVLLATSPLLIMTFSGNFNNFGVIYFITGGGPGVEDIHTAYAGSTDILISWIYKLTTDTAIRQYNMASVFSILIFLIIGSISAWNFTRTRAFREDD